MSFAQNHQATGVERRGMQIPKEEEEDVEALVQM